MCFGDGGGGVAPDMLEEFVVQVLSLPVVRNKRDYGYSSEGPPIRRSE